MMQSEDELAKLRYQMILHISNRCQIEEYGDAKLVT